MRLTCDADIVSRLLPSHNMKKAGRSCRAQLTIGKKTGPNNKDGVIYLMMCTAKDRNGTKFVLLNNVEQIFGRFIAEGKATVRFRDPPQDLCLSKGDPLQLKTFLNIVKVGAQGKDLDSTTLSSLSIPSAKKVERPKTKMVVMSRRDYPMTTNFPSSLTHLQISQCTMKRVDSRVLQLKNLEVLDLSQNILHELPECWDKMKCLSRLILHTNSFSKFPLCLCKGSLQQTLTFLDLSHNTLTVIPPHLCLLENLVGLKLDNNQLTGLPATIGRLSKLKTLTASGNQLDCLPAGFLGLRLESLDLFGNPFSMAEQSPSQEQMEFPTLLEITARIIKNKKLPYDEESLHGHLCHYLDSARTCWCGSPCFQCATRYVRKVNLEKLSTEVTAVNVFGSKQAPVESFLCSQKCLLKFQCNPYAYWRK